MPRRKRQQAHPRVLPDAPRRKGRSATPGCQTCHGASDAHVKNPQGVSPRPQPDTVFGIGPNASPPSTTRPASVGSLSQVGQPHLLVRQRPSISRSRAASNCHVVHAPSGQSAEPRSPSPRICFTCHKTQRAQINMISTHPILVGKVACSDCHNPHGSTAAKLLVKDTTNETCYTCHAEKRGPFLWEHSSSSTTAAIAIRRTARPSRPCSRLAFHGFARNAIAATTAPRSIAVRTCRRATRRR